MDADVIVIGAGLSGLTAAKRLARAGRRVLVLEARDRVGGRTLSQDVAGGRFDLGGQWLGPDQHRVIALARALGVRTFPTWCKGRKVLDLQGKISTYESDIPSISPLHLLVLQAGLSRLARAHRGLEMGSLWSGPRAAALDGVTVGELRRRMIPSRRVRALFDVAARVIFGAEPEELSALYGLGYLEAGGGLLKLAEITGGAQQDRFVEGAQALSERLAASLGGAVLLEAPVRRIAQGADAVEVFSDRGRFCAARAILALPPTMAGRIAFDQPLSAARDQLAQRMFMGQTVKCLAVYARPFWREAGFSGEVVCTGGPLDVIFDNTSHDGAQPALLGFVVGERARAWARLGEWERREAALSAFARYFGAEASAPLAYVEKDWGADPWSRGCPVGNLGAGGVLACAEALQRPEGRLHFAGTEAATAWTGYLEGAIQSGERAADELRDL